MPCSLATLIGLLLVSPTLIAPFMVLAQSPPTPVPPEWQTHAERTNYRETPRYGETVEYCRRLAAAASSLIRFMQFGRSGEGRALPLVIAARGGTWTPHAAKKLVKRLC